MSGMRCPAFAETRKPGTWLYRIAVNTALLYRRKWRRGEPLPEVVDPSAGAHQDLEDRERLAALRRAIAVLPDQDRLVITLLLEGLSLPRDCRSHRPEPSTTSASRFHASSRRSNSA